MNEGLKRFYEEEIFNRQVKIDRKLTLVQIFVVLYFIVLGLASIALILGILHIFPNSDFISCVHLRFPRILIPNLTE